MIFDLINAIYMGLSIFCAGLIEKYFVYDIVSSEILNTPINIAYFGKNKKWRGIVCFPLVHAIVVGIIQLIEHICVRGNMIFYYGKCNWITYGIVIGLTFNLAELPNSYIKRRIGIAPGDSTNITYIIDHMDSTYLCIAMQYFLFNLPGSLCVILLILGPFLHMLNSTMRNPKYAKLFYVPNIIDYVRIVLLLVSYYAMYCKHAFYAMTLYGISMVLDHFDGYFARLLNQRTEFGKCLDMIIDRISPIGLIIFICLLDTNVVLLGIALISLDISSHICRIYSFAVNNETNHKETRKSKFELLNKYYRNTYNFMDILIIGQEVTYVAYYLSLHYKTPSYVYMCTLPFLVMKHFINLLQLIDACAFLL